MVQRRKKAPATGARAKSKLGDFLVFSYVALLAVHLSISAILLLAAAVSDQEVKHAIAMGVAFSALRNERRDRSEPPAARYGEPPQERDIKHDAVDELVEVNAVVVGVRGAHRRPRAYIASRRA